MGILDGIETQDMSESSGILKILMNTKDYQQSKIMSEVPPDLVWQLTLTNVVMEKYQSKFLKSVNLELYRHQIAKDRKGRLEAVEVGSSMMHQSAEED